MCFCLSITQKAVRMKIAVIGQSLFGQEVYKELRKDSHTIVGVFTIPDKDGKADPLGEHSTLTGTSLPLPKRHVGAVRIELNLSLKSQKKKSYVSVQLPDGIWTPHSTGFYHFGPLNSCKSCIIITVCVQVPLPLPVVKLYARKTLIRNLKKAVDVLSLLIPKTPN